DIEDNIIITTYHSSKGLEAPVVFMVEVDKVYVGELDSEQLKRKLIYVAMTRASEKLYISSKVNNDGKYISELKRLANQTKC
ncbi:MAG: ATP-binding domain-containing protein, partial [Turicibacter sp.]|nr:ATP-binding domain-containing protein [Turicibacter sp.]